MFWQLFQTPILFVNKQAVCNLQAFMSHAGLDIHHAVLSQTFSKAHIKNNAVKNVSF
jgi:hypothetical protein